MTKYLITGAAGFIASKVTEMLLKSGHTVIGVDNMNDAYDTRLKEWRLQQLQAYPCFFFHKLDICDRRSLEQLFCVENALGNRITAVINLAARAGVRQSVVDPWVYIDTNVTGTLNLLEECRKHSIMKFVLASTSSLYGATDTMPYHEEQSTDAPLSPYAASKKAAEAMCHSYHYLHGIDVTVMRYFTVYGPAGRPDMSLFRFVQWISEGKPVKMFGDGMQRRDFTYVDDIARGTIAALRPIGYEVINLGSDRPIPLLDAIVLVQKLVGQDANLVLEPRHAADMQATWADVAKADRLLDWRALVSFEEGVGNLVDWYNKNRTWAREIATGE